MVNTIGVSVEGLACATGDAHFLAAAYSLDAGGVVVERVFALEPEIVARPDEVLMLADERFRLEGSVAVGRLAVCAVSVLRLCQRKTHDEGETLRVGLRTELVGPLVVAAPDARRLPLPNEFEVPPHGLLQKRPSGTPEEPLLMWNWRMAPPAREMVQTDGGLWVALRGNERFVEPMT